jgi:small-conductance mechanosensitive channel
MTRILRNAAETIGEALPRIGGAILLLIVGLLAAYVLGGLTRRALAAVGLDDLAERFGVHAVLERIGIAPPLSRVAGKVVRIVLIVATVFASVSLLGFAALSDSLNAALLFLPRVLVALALIVAGAVVAQLLADRTERLATQMAMGDAVARVVQAAVFAVFLVTALTQLGISTELLTVLVAIAFIAVALTGALAFGLGSREVAREVSAGRYVGGAFTIGQTISVDGVRGEIVALERAATVLQADDGVTVRIPNHLLVESVVRLEDEGSPGASAADSPISA